MNSSDLAPMVAVSVMFIMGGLAFIFRGPLGKAIARRIEGNIGSPELEARVVELEHRLTDVEQERAELAERVEFAERVLLQMKDAPKELGR